MSPWRSRRPVGRWRSRSTTRSPVAARTSGSDRRRGIARAYSGRAQRVTAILRGAVASFRLIAVEDDADLRSLLTRGLSEEGFDVRAMPDAAAALAAADQP